MFGLRKVKKKKVERKNARKTSVIMKKLFPFKYERKMKEKFIFGRLSK